MATLFIDPLRQYVGSVKLAYKVLESSYRPEGIIGVLRGGAVPGLVTQEIFKLRGLDLPLDFITTKSYDSSQQRSRIEIRGLSEIVVSNRRLLVVDDLWDTGKTLCEIRSALLAKGATEIRTATLYVKNREPKAGRFLSTRSASTALHCFKPHKNQYTPLAPDYYLESLNNDTWVVFPHELNDIDKESLASHPLYPHLLFDS